MQARKQETKANIDQPFSDAIDGVLLSAAGETVADGLDATASMLIRMNVSIFITDDDAGLSLGMNHARSSSLVHGTRTPRIPMLILSFRSHRTMRPFIRGKPSDVLCYMGPQELLIG